VRNPIRNEASFVLVVAVIFSAVAIPVLSGFLEPSQPPAVAAVQIEDPRDRPSRHDGASARESKNRLSKTDPVRSERRRPALSPKRERPTQPAPSPPPEDTAEDDGGETD
jgi:hypothetical protein